MTTSSQHIILFQGDSITDCGRNRSPEADGIALGNGYASMVAARLTADRPDAGYEFRNFGISGNRIVDLAARAKEHIWNLRPSLLSILIGVNDTWHEFMRGSGVDVARYERTYRHLMEDTVRHCPGIRLMLCEPFVLPCGVVGAGWREEVDERRAVVAGLCRDFGATLVPFQEIFDRALDRAPAEFWAPDGVHPSPAGHQIMADEWIRRMPASW